MLNFLFNALRFRQATVGSYCVSCCEKRVTLVEGILLIWKLCGGFCGHAVDLGSCERTVPFSATGFQNNIMATGSVHIKTCTCHLQRVHTSEKLWTRDEASGY